MSTVDYHTVYVLHQRPYTDSKILVELLSRKYGRVNAVHRASKKSRSSGGLAYFRSMEAKWGGKGQLKTLHAIEPNTSAEVFALEGKTLFCGLYLNELLTRALAESDESALEESGVIFNLYEQSLKKLAKNTTLKEVEPVLRKFEYCLLAALGFGVDFSSDTGGNSIEEDLQYGLVAGEGFSPVQISDESAEPRLEHGATYAKDKILTLPGKAILAIGAGDFSAPESLKYAKLMSRILLPLVIGDRPLKSRELFV